METDTLARLLWHLEKLNLPQEQHGPIEILARQLCGENADDPDQIDQLGEDFAATRPVQPLKPRGFGADRRLGAADSGFMPRVRHLAGWDN